mmetsp:Transcript_9323/g.10492  ORF Transcript_9323/g.10492 Transcript_9323/m.10492 type:complete len:96 (+) Transcript_9323:330-617(+)
MLHPLLQSSLVLCSPMFTAKKRPSHSPSPSPLPPDDDFMICCVVVVVVTHTLAALHLLISFFPEQQLMKEADTSIKDKDGYKCNSSARCTPGKEI